MEQLLRATLPVDEDSPAGARLLVGMVAEDLGPEPLGTVALLTHELVMNSVRHASMGPGGEIRLTVARSGPEVMVEVADRGRGFKPAAASDPEGGLGLKLVQKMSTRWGISSDEERTSVWFYLRPDELAQDAGSTRHPAAAML